MGKIVINKTDAGQKVLLDTAEEGVTGGYFDKQEQWHEFVMGNTFINPEVHITAIRGENVDADIEIPIAYGLIVEDGYIYHDQLYLPKDENETEISFYATGSEQPDTFYLIKTGERYVYNFAVSNAVNCSLTSENEITVDDISVPCSFTITYTEALPLGG